MPSQSRRSGGATRNRRLVGGSTAIALLAALLAGAAQNATAMSGESIAVTSPSGPAAQRQSDAVYRLQARKMFAQTNIAKIVDAHQDLFGGYYADGYSVLNIAVVKGAPATRTRPLVAKILGLAKPADVKIIQRPVEKSYAELQSIADAVRPDRPSPAMGSGVTGTEIDVATNTLIVYTNTDVAKFASRAKSKYAEAVQIQKGEIGDDLSRIKEPGNYNGGAYFRGLTTNWPCTRGFTIRNKFGKDYMLTAGHCANAGESVAYRPQSSEVAFVPFKHYPGASDLDNLLLDTTSVTDAVHKPFIWSGPPGGQSGQELLPVSGAAESCLGCDVFFDGMITGKRLGTLTGGSNCRQFESGYSCGLQRVTSGSICEEGDSGGPVFAYSPPYVVAVGIIKGKTQGQCVYTKIQPILDYWVATMTPLPF